MAFDFLEKLKEATEEIEIMGQTVSKREAFDGLRTIGVDLPPVVQDLFPDKVSIIRLYINRKTDPDTIEIQMAVETPPLLDFFTKIMMPVAEEIWFDVKTNQPSVDKPGVKETTWAISVQMEIFSNKVTIKSESRNPNRFELQEPFPLGDENFFTKGPGGFSLPQELIDFMPAKKVSLDKLIVDDSTPTAFVEMETSMEFRKFPNELFNKFITIPERCTFYYKQEASSD